MTKRIKTLATAQPHHIKIIDEYKNAQKVLKEAQLAHEKALMAYRKVVNILNKPFTDEDEEALDAYIDSFTPEYLAVTSRKQVYIDGHLPKSVSITRFGHVMIRERGYTRTNRNGVPCWRMP